MKIKRMFIAVLAVISVLPLYGCSDDSKEISENVNASSTAAEFSSSEDSEFQVPTKSFDNSPKFDVEEGKLTFFNGNEYGNRIDTIHTAGIYLNAPKGMNIYNGNTIDQHTIIIPSSIPTVSEPILVTDENGNNMNFFVSVGQDYNEFAELEQSDVEATFLEGVKDAFDKCEIVSFEKGIYDDYQGIKMAVNSKMQGFSFKQTIILINAVKQDSNGYMYTITYTDMTGDNDEAIETSISTIVFADPSRIVKEYPDPEDLAKVQKEEAEKKAETLKKYMKPGNTKITRPNGESLVKTPGELRKSKIQ